MTFDWTNNNAVPSHVDRSAQSRSDISGLTNGVGKLEHEDDIYEMVELEGRSRIYRPWGMFQTRNHAYSDFVFIHCGWDEMLKLRHTHMPPMHAYDDFYEEGGTITIAFNHIAFRLEGDNLYENIWKLRHLFRLRNIDFIQCFDERFFETPAPGSPIIRKIEYLPPALALQPTEKPE